MHASALLTSERVPHAAAERTAYADAWGCFGSAPCAIRNVISRFGPSLGVSVRRHVP
jgi:hypothetical protein